MSIVKHRSLHSIIKGVWTHSLSILTMFSFPYQVTVALHRMRGVKIGRQSHVARGVILDDRNPELIEIGNGVAVTSGVMILCHQRDLTDYKPGMYAMHCPFKEGKVVVKDGEIISELSLPIAGLISDKDFDYVVGKCEELNKAAHSIGCKLEDPFMTMGFLSLPVIPELKITDKGVFDTNTFDFTDIFQSAVVIQ